MYAGGGVLGGADAVALTDIGNGVWEGNAVVNGVNLCGTLPSSIALLTVVIGVYNWSLLC